MTGDSSDSGVEESAPLEVVAMEDSGEAVGFGAALLGIGTGREVGCGEGWRVATTDATVLTVTSVATAVATSEANVSEARDASTLSANNEGEPDEVLLRVVATSKLTSHV